LTEVFNKVIMNHPADAFDKFEEISALVKQTHLKFKDPEKDSEVNTAHQKPAATNAAIHVNKTRDLLSGTTQGVSAAMLSKKAFTLPNFAEESEMLEWANIGFGEEETYKLQHSLKRLFIMSGSARGRFAGKIYGTQKDYWVASGVLDEVDEEDMPANLEKRGNGTN
jgi:hypothetical protein